MRVQFIILLPHFSQVDAASQEIIPCAPGPTQVVCMAGGSSHVGVHDCTLSAKVFPLPSHIGAWSFGEFLASWQTMLGHDDASAAASVAGSNDAMLLF